MTRNDINKMTPEIEKYCTDFWDQNNILPSGPFDRAAQNEAMVPHFKSLPLTVDLASTTKRFTAEEFEMPRSDFDRLHCSGVI